MKRRFRVRKEGISKHLGREEGNKKKEKKGRQLVLEVQGGLMILQGPGI